MSDLINHTDFSQTWQQRHRGSVPRKAKTSSKGEYFWIGFWIVVAISAAAFSAAHTIPAAEMTFFKANTNRAELANTAFVMVELVIFGGAAGRRKYRILGWLLMGALLVALAGNVSSTIAAVLQNGGNTVTQFGGVLLALLAPLTALVAGEVVHRELDTLAMKRLDAQTAFEVAWREMEAKINAAYTKYERDWQAQRAEQEGVSSLNEPTTVPIQSVHSLNSVNEPVNGNGYMVNSVNSYTKHMNAREIISAYFERHPDHMGMKLDELVTLIQRETGQDIKRTSIHNVRRDWQAQRAEQERAAVAGTLPLAAVAQGVSRNGAHGEEEG